LQDNPTQVSSVVADVGAAVSACTCSGDGAGTVTAEFNQAGEF
jgi:hypothetical protein